MTSRSFLTALVAGLFGWARPAPGMVEMISPVRLDKSTSTLEMPPLTTGGWWGGRPHKSYNGGRNRHARHGAPKHTSRAKPRKRARAKAKRRACR